jgi:hypothetical protein
MKRVAALSIMGLLLIQFSYSELPQFAGGSFSSSLQNAVSLPSTNSLLQFSFSGYGYASLTDNLFLGGFGEGFGGQNTTSGYGGLALGVLLNRGETPWYLLNFTGVGLLGYRNVPYFGMIEELTINRGILLSNRFLFTVYLGLNFQANLSGEAFAAYSSLAPILGARIDFGDYKRIAN